MEGARPVSTWSFVKRARAARLLGVVEVKAEVETPRPEGPEMPSPGARGPGSKRTDFNDPNSWEYCGCGFVETRWRHAGPLPCGGCPECEPARGPGLLTEGQG